MTIAPERLAEIAQQVAHRVRQQIPRSSNRFLDAGDDETGWLKSEGKIEYTEFLQTFARISTKGPTQDVIKKVEKEPVLCVFTKTVSRDASVRELKDAVLDFLKNGKIDGNPIDLNYKPGLDAEKEYSRKFGAALADYLNARGMREGKKKFVGDSVMRKVRNQVLGNDRTIQAGTGAAALPIPSKNIASGAKNAFKFGVGNCEECGCAAYAMLLTFSNAEGSPLAALSSTDNIRVELIKGKSDGDAHFFVLLNRSGAVPVFDDFARWFADPTVIVCDPWITDTGVGGSIMATSKDMLEVRRFLKPDGKEGPESLNTRASGFLGATADLKDDPGFHMPA